MNKKLIESLYRELPDLVKNGVLTQEAADSLKRHYAEVKITSKKWFMFMLCGLVGTILIGLGIILIFAHNWDQLSRLTRTVLSLVPLVIGQGFAFWVLVKRPKSSIFKECAATFLTLMVGSSLALVCQIYNIPGDTASFTFVWMMLIVPLVYLMQASIPAVVYCIGITVWSGQFWNEPLHSVFFWPLVALIIPHFIWSLRQEKYSLRAAILSFVLMVCVYAGTQITLGNGLPLTWFVIEPCLMVIFYLVGSYKFKGISTNWQLPLLRIGALGIFVHAFAFTFLSSWSTYSEVDIFGLAALPGNIMSLIIVSVSILMLYDFVKRRQLMPVLFGSLSLLAVVVYFITMAGASNMLAVFIFNIYLFALSIIRIILGARSNRLDVVNTGMLMLAILILARFFDSDINFILKGVVFIAVGLGFLLANIIMLKQARSQR